MSIARVAGNPAVAAVGAAAIATAPRIQDDPVQDINAGQCHENVIFVNLDAVLRPFCRKSWRGIKVTLLKVESVNLYVESDWQNRTSSPPKQRGLPELVFQLMGDMCAYENRLRITASASFRDVNKKSWLGIASSLVD